MAYKPAKLPPERQSPDATVEEVMAFRRESSRSVFRQIRDETYEGYESRERRLVPWSSVSSHREWISRGSGFWD
jgi:hypothetical protein